MRPCTACISWFRKFALLILASMLCFVLATSLEFKSAIASPVTKRGQSSHQISYKIYLPYVTKVPREPWVKAFSEGFEGVFPGAWELLSDPDDYSWGKRNCHAASGSYGGWAVGGMLQGKTLPCKEGYPGDSHTWMIYGPVDLSRVKDGQMSLKIWSDIEDGYDEMGWGVSLDNKYFYGQFYTGNSGGWITDTIDLKNANGIGNITGKPQVWIGIWFDSDEINQDYEEGAAVDDLVLWTCSSSGGCAGSPSNPNFALFPESLHGLSPTSKSRPEGHLQFSPLLSPDLHTPILSSPGWENPH